MKLKNCKLDLISVVFAIFNLCSIESLGLGPSSQPEAYFNGSSYLRLQTTISLKRQAGLSFRTCTGGNLLKQQQTDDYFELYVKVEGVVFSAKTASQHISAKIQGNFLNNKWHVVILQYELGNLTLRVDNEERLIANATYNNVLLTNPNLYNEGASVLLIGKQFNGCLLEGPSLVFDPSLILYNLNVIFEKCPIPDDSCVPKENLRDHDSCQNEPCMRQGTCHNGINGYTCSCLPRYTGKNCEIDVGNPCEKTPSICKNGATCNFDNNGEYTCWCPPNFTGKHCEQEVIVHPQCQHNPCQNGGTCTFNGELECLCLPGFIGSRCELNIDECKPNLCKNGGICHDGLNNFTCDCSRTGYKGRLCEDNINECLSNPCLNHGTCFDNYGGYFCQCPPGYGGSHCQNSECMSHPCLNHGQCINNIDGFKCNCPSGFAGERCEVEDRQILCDVNICLPFGDCIESGNSVGCVCKPEYPGMYPNCSVDNICLNNPCKNAGSCVSWNGFFNCSCLPGFTGKFCESLTDGCISQPCKNGGICLEQHSGIFCNCTDQWMGTFCEIPYDACELKPCYNNATCITAPNKHDFACNCLPGFTGIHCEVNIDDCIGIRCPNGHICYDLTNHYECRCPPGYEGDNCSVDVEPCSKEPCLNGGICELSSDKHGFICLCPKNFTGERCHLDFDECKDRPGICNEGICQNTVGSFQCYCRPGYTGERCNLDFDECLSMPCQNDATCINKINNYECLCPPGYEGKDCSININECEPIPCMNGSTCIDGINEFTCMCQPGLTGRICDINIDDCESSPCLNGADCIDGLNSYTCNCTDTGYMGTHCEINIDDCIGNPCQNGAKCVDKVKDYHCSCYLGYTGKNCEIDINECDSSPCKYNGTCLERSNTTLYQIASSTENSLPEIFSRPFSYKEAAGYECLCVEGVTGENCEVDINECESSPCLEGTCVDKIGGYVCDCNEGFEGDHCDIDIDECERYRPCIHGKCIDKRASYYCDCDSNYGGKNCSVELTGCEDNPCLNNGTCKPYLINENIHRFNCSCPHGFHGHTCEKITTMSLTGKSIITISTAREEGYDIQFRFKTTLGDGLLALGKGLTYYILELSKGRLNLHSSLLNKWEGVFIGSNLNDSNWQRVFVAINSTHLVLSANDEQTIYPISFNENFNGTTYTSFPVTYIGGTPSNLKKLTHGQPYLVGCTEDVLINGEWVLPQDQEITSVKYDQVEVSCQRQPQCNPNPCHSGGHCTDLWLDFRCTCGRPYLGHTCQYNYTAATFGYENITNSLVIVNVDSVAKRAVRTIVDISMFIRTRQTAGQIFYLGSAPKSKNPLDDTYIAAELESGELLVRIQFNGTPEAYTVGGVKLNNGYDHLIEVIRNVTLVQVKLNGTEYFRKTISATGTLDAQVLYLGGPPQTRPVRQTNDNFAKMDPIAPTTSAVIASPPSDVHFKGIIQDVQISNGSSTMIVEFFPLNAEELEIPLSFGDVIFDNQTVLEGVRSDNSCKVNPCEHGGICENTWNDYRCICTRGFKGKNCQDLEFCEIDKCPTNSVCKNLEDGSECVANATFDGKIPPLQYHRVVWPNSTKSITYNTLELTYRTRSWGTALFAKYEDDYFVIFIYHNEVVVEWRLSNIIDKRRFRRDHFEGQWLTLYFEYQNGILRGGFKDMVIDEIPNMKVINFDIDGYTEILKNGEIYIGGSDGETFDYQSLIESADLNMTGYIPVSDTTTTISITSNSLELNDDSSDIFFYKIDQNKKTDRFKGCLSEIRIGGLLLPYFTPDQLSLKNHYFELSPSVKPEIGCILCYPSDCYNNGICINPLDTYKCNCSKGYAADDCSIDINECENNKCENNATCVDLIGEYKCKCEAGFDGEFCEHDIDECLSNPCRHGGTCNNGIGTFKCECPEGFAGKQCEAPILITCENKPCKEGATCKTGPNDATGNNFTCFCNEGMEGPLCDTPFCLREHCQNGSCNTTSEVPFCQCINGFKGKFCEINIDDCTGPTGQSRCQNEGICIDGVNRFDCNCNGTGYNGLLCEMDIDECKTNEPCGRLGICDNLPGTYRCTCEDNKKCGHFCKLDNPCETIKPCIEGTCIPLCADKADYECKCNENYTGKNCSELKVAASQMDHVNILYIVIPIVLILSIGIAIGLAVLVNIARSKRATRGTYSPSAQEFCNPRVELDHVLKPPPEERLI